jgi:hypothetical protein
MSLSHAMPLTGAIPAKLVVAARPRVAPIHADIEAVHTAVKSADGILQRRGQRVEIAQDRGWTAPYISRAKLSAMLAHAICEVSGLAQSQSCIRLRVSSQGIAISGRNPVVLPDDRLQVDDILRLRCHALGVPVTLFWEQGTGPCLVLYLPKAR